ncbi:hypothetical protein V8E51_009829 [Hyaloscypha variabilis]
MCFPAQVGYLCAGSQAGCLRALVELFGSYGLLVPEQVAVPTQAVAGLSRGCQANSATRGVMRGIWTSLHMLGE